jgi:hypothetical protein
MNPHEALHFYRGNNHPAFAVPVVVILSLLGKKLNGVQYFRAGTAMGTQGLCQGAKGKVHLKNRCLPAQLLRGMGVGIGDDRKRSREESAQFIGGLEESPVSTAGIRSERSP